MKLVTAYLVWLESTGYQIINEISNCIFGLASRINYTCSNGVGFQLQENVPDIPDTSARNGSERKVYADDGLSSSG